MEIQRAFKEFKSIIDTSTIDPLSLFQPASPTIETFINFEQNEEFAKLASLLEQYGSLFAKSELESLKELHIVKIFQMDQIMAQRRSLLVQVANICHFYSA